MTTYIEGLKDLSKPYKGLVVDLWGVMHNGREVFDEARAALVAARQQGLAITLLSNAPRRRDFALAGLARLGLSAELYDDLITSGEVAWQAIKAGAEGTWGPKVHLFGAEKDLPMREGLDHLAFVADLRTADWILNIGPEAGHQDVAPFQPYLDEAKARGLPMVCANPDLIVQRGAETEICAGALAIAYAGMGGDVRWYGKPHAEVYRAVYASNGLAPEALLAIGDSLKTDVKGANAQGMDVLFVGTGIHGREVGTPLNMAKLAELAKAEDAMPTYASEALRAIGQGLQ